MGNNTVFVAPQASEVVESVHCELTAAKPLLVNGAAYQPNTKVVVVGNVTIENQGGETVVVEIRGLPELEDANANDTAAVADADANHEPAELVPSERADA